MHSIVRVKASDYRANHDSFYVERMRDAGLLLIGKANLPEMGMWLSKCNVVRSLTRPRIREEKVVRRDMFFDCNGARPSHPR
jgi:hypothetical protein